MKVYKRKRYCCVPGCKTGYVSETRRLKDLGKKNPSLFNVPSEPETLKQWQEALGTKEKQLSSADAVCARHFIKGDILYFHETKLKDGTVHQIERGWPKLRKGAVPSIFPNTNATLGIISSSDKKRKLFQEANEFTAIKRQQKYQEENEVPPLKKVKYFSSEYNSKDIGDRCSQTSSGRYKFSETFDELPSAFHSENNPTEQISIAKNTPAVLLSYKYKGLEEKLQKIADTEGDKTESCFLFEELKRIIPTVINPDKNWSGTFIPAKNEVVFMKWEDSYINKKRIVIGHDLSFKILFGNTEIELKEKDLTIKSPSDLEKIIKCVHKMKICSGINLIRSFDTGGLSATLEPFEEELDVPELVNVNRLIDNNKETANDLLKVTPLLSEIKEESFPVLVKVEKDIDDETYGPLSGNSGVLIEKGIKFEDCPIKLENEELEIFDGVNLKRETELDSLPGPSGISEMLKSQQTNIDIKEESTDTGNLQNILLKENINTFNDALEKLFFKKTKPLTKRKLKIKPIFQCDQCPFTSKWKHSMKAHLETHLPVDQRPIYKCSSCNYQSVCESLVKKHKMIHVNNGVRKVKMHECPHCPFKTQWKESFNRHKNVHSNPEELVFFKCDICDYQTTRKHRIRDHKITHKTKEEAALFECFNCSFKSKSKVGIQKHMERHVKPGGHSVYYKCNQCNYVTFRKHALNRHIGRVHKS